MLWTAGSTGLDKDIFSLTTSGRGENIAKLLEPTMLVGDLLGSLRYSRFVSQNLRSKFASILFIM
jgi:hypothetical protein